MNATSAASLYFPVGLGAFFLIVFFCLAYLSGWRRLARQYPRQERPNRESFFCRSAWIGYHGVSYNACVRIIPDDAGIYVYTLYFPFHPPFLGPWREVAMKQSKHWFWGDQEELTIGGESDGLHLLISLDAAGEVARFMMASATRSKSHV